VPGVNRNLGAQFERTVTRQCAKTHFDPKLDEVDPPRDAGVGSVGAHADNE
jgi:hypothetical protein